MPLTGSVMVLREILKDELTLMNNDIKILNKILATELNSTLKELYTITKWDLSLGCKDGSTYEDCFV